MLPVVGLLLALALGGRWARGLALILLWLGLAAWAQHTQHAFGGDSQLTKGDISSSRFAIWSNTLELIARHPWLGVGFGNYDNAYLSYNLLYWDLSLGHAHNYYLNVFGETGMIGLLAYGVLVLTMTARLWRIRRHPDTAVRWLGIGLLGSWVYLTVHSLTDNLYVNNLFLHIGAIIALVAVLDDQLSRVTYD